jgi:small subunit ribosomal protein S20
MANHASALKRNRQNQKRKLLNQMNRRKLRTQIRKLRTAITLGNAEETRRLLPGTYSLIDRSVQKGVIRSNTAARYKARLTRHVNRVAA